LAGAQLGEDGPHRRFAGSATSAEGRRRSGEDGNLLGGDSRSAENRSLEGRQEASYFPKAVGPYVEQRLSIEPRIRLEGNNPPAPRRENKIAASPTLAPTSTTVLLPKSKSS